MAFNSISFAQDEQPPVTKWNQLNNNDDYLKAEVDQITDWQTYTPSIANFTQGNGTVQARYGLIKQWCVGLVQIALGSTSSISGTVDIELPAEAHNDLELFRHTLGEAIYFDNSGSQQYFGALGLADVYTEGRLRLKSISGSNIVIANLAPTTPFTWATSDEINITFAYPTVD